MNAMLGAAFVLGVAGSAHCIGMCGPIALAVPSPRNTHLSRLGSGLLLNAGRLVSYSFLGAAIGAFGAGLELVGLQRGVTISAGVLLLLTVLVPGLLERWAPTGRIAMWIARLRSVLARNLERTSPEALFFTGVLNGLLPCGLVYAALIGAAAMTDALEGAAFMAFFALGTWPALVAVRISAGLLGDGLRHRLRRLAPVLVAMVAVLIILRGLELGIPYVSPDFAAVPNGANACH